MNLHFPVFTTENICHDCYKCIRHCPCKAIRIVDGRAGVIQELCVACGMCVKVCPAGCIDPHNGTLDNERCVRCMNCVSACRLQAVKFALPERKTPPVDQARRAFLINGGVLVAGVAAGMVLAKTGMGKLAEYAKRFLILPPGAGDAERFAARCTACQLCTANCPAKIIVPAPGGDGPVSLDLGARRSVRRGRAGR